MEPFRTLTDRAAPLMLANVDTDVIIRIERLTAPDQSVLGRYAFEALRYRPDGSEDPDFILNQPAYRGASILLAGSNFGCGSSREGAVTALMGMGLRCVIAPSFGDIFFGNCFQNGMLAIRLSEDEISALVRQAIAGAPFTVDLDAQCVVAGDARIRFEIDPQRRESLLTGLDDLGLTLTHLDKIRAWQTSDRQARPWVWEPVTITPGDGV
jgi:3-isopropylmalate/(R)-2-methylmalate dehydratase small subunit